MATSVATEKPIENSLIRLIKQLQPDSLTPKAALDALYRLKAEIEE